MTQMVVAEVEAVSGRTVYEVQHVNGYRDTKTGAISNQTLSDPFYARKDAKEYMEWLGAVKGTDRDPLADYWSRHK